VSTPITNIPQGFIALTGLRDMGGVPREVQSVITPGIDITQFLLLNREIVSGSHTFTTVTGASPSGTTVPNGELWYVHAAQGETDLMPAGETISYNLSQADPTPITQSDTVTATAGARASAWLQDKWLRPGSAIGIRVMAITTAAGLTVSVRCLITRLRI
jgi:hypothetical protein